MAMDGVDGMNTVGLWIDGPSVFRSGDSFQARCKVLLEEPYRGVISRGKQFHLWDGGFFADGEVLEVMSENWEKDTTGQ
jgi:hypothetical protein